MNTFRYISILAVVIMLAFSCGDKSDPVAVIPPGNGGDGGNGGGVELSFAADIQPIFAAYCLGCHSSGLSGAQRNGAPPAVNFDTYQAASANAQRANARIQAGTMPPGGSVPSDERATIQLWLSEGTPQ